MATAKRTKKPERVYRSRIVGHGDVAPAKIKAHAENWRLHPDVQAQVMTGVLSDVGWVQDVIINKRTGNLLDGHMRVEIADRDGEPTVPVTYVDLSEDEERKVLASFDSLGGLAVMDGEAFADLTDGMQFETPEMRDFLDDLRLQAGELVIKPLTAEAIGASPEMSGGDRKRHMTLQAVVKVALPVAAVETLESALAATGCTRRDEALEAVCRSYLEALNIKASA